MTDGALRGWDRDDPRPDQIAVVERAIGVLVLALRETPEAVTAVLEGAALRHDVSVHDLADAVLTAAQGQPVPDALLRKILWQEWGELLT